MNAEGVVLAGGTSTRMGGNNKALIEVDGQPLFRYAVDNLRPQVQKIWINTNSNLNYFQSLGFNVCSDGEFLHKGPLAGIYSAMMECTADVLLIAPCDQLTLPEHVYRTLLEKVDVNRGAFASDGVDDVPTCAALPTSSRSALRELLLSNKLRLMPFIHKHCQKVSFPEVEFSNLNHLEINQGPIKKRTVREDPNSCDPTNKDQE